MPYAVGEYYERVSDYDLAYQGQTEQDVPFWIELLARFQPEHVLELACGSGRIGLELLRLPTPFELEGLDISSDMLAAYQRKATRELPEALPRLTLHEGDMTDFSLPNQGNFDLVILPFNSISHLYDLESQLSAFKATWDHLRPGGHFVVDVMMPDLDYLSNALNRPSYVYLEDEVEDPGSESTMLMYSSRKYDPVEQNQHITWTHERFYETSGEHERYLTRLDMHTFFPRELQLLFLATGFSIEAFYGSYKWAPVGKGTRQIIIGRKPADLL
jgi:SAM-dependent methyltransferase